MKPIREFKLFVPTSHDWCPSYAEPRHDSPSLDRTDDDDGDYYHPYTHGGTHGYVLVSLCMYQDGKIRLHVIGKDDTEKDYEYVTAPDQARAIFDHLQIWLMTLQNINYGILNELDPEPGLIQKIARRKDWITSEDVHYVLSEISRQQHVHNSRRRDASTGLP